MVGFWYFRYTKKTRKYLKKVNYLKTLSRPLAKQIYACVFY